jgi:2-polyprenyl-3-methyl-5-hydroxy-6-metoxy-1,4-benzoquinol methylase
MQQYESYSQWKNWSLDFSFSEEDRLYYEKEFGKIVRSGDRVIEIGFGSGGFLSWAKQRGAETYGVEVQEEIIAAANEHGFIAVSQIDLLFPHRQQGFDAIVAVDVFEHLSTEEIQQALKSIEKLLKPSGALIIRVPNGGSPFGLWNQYGDKTHVSVMTPTKMNQLAFETKLRVVEIRNQARVLPRGTVGQRFRAWLSLGLREILNQAIARIYGLPTTLDQNLVMVLKNTGESNQSN